MGRGEDDYVDFLVMTDLRQFPPAITMAFQKRHILFLGYSLEDWNFRVILRKIQLAVGSPDGEHDDSSTLRTVSSEDYHSWALQKGPSQIEKRFWQKRGVDLYDVDLNTFVEVIAECLAK